MADSTQTGRVVGIDLGTTNSLVGMVSEGKVRLFADERESLDSAYAGDVVGLANPGVFAIGDTLYEGAPVAFEPIPSFAPEHFASVRSIDSAGYKSFGKGIAQLREEGAVQVFYPWDSARTEPVLAVVGELQFERPASGAGRDMPHLAEDLGQRYVRRRRELRLPQHVLHIVAVQRARQEILAVGRRNQAPRKAQKLQWIVAIRRQPCRRHVQKKGVVAHGVRHAPAHRRPALDQYDIREVDRGPAQQARCQHRAAESAAHDD